MISREIKDLGSWILDLCSRVYLFLLFLAVCHCRSISLANKIFEPTASIELTFSVSIRLDSVIRNLWLPAFL